MSNPRDTHFLGFASALFQEMQADLTALYVALGSRREQDIASAESIIQQLIARRTYDLVKHTILNIGPADLDMLTTEECVQRVPDLTELPKEVQE